MRLKGLKEIGILGEVKGAEALEEATGMALGEIEGVEVLGGVKGMALGEEGMDEGVDEIEAPEG